MKQKFLFYLVGLAVALFSGGSYANMFTNVTTITGSTKANILTDATGATVDGDEVISIHEILAMAAQESPFADNMVGKLGSGKPICMNTDISRVIGNKVIIPTVERLGAPMVQGATERVGNEERRKVGDFVLQCDIGWFGVGITNTGLAQTILGANWDSITKEDLALRLAKQQSDDTMVALRNLAANANLVVPNGKTVDTLGTADTFSYALVVKSGGRLRDLGAKPIDARKVSDQSTSGSTKIARHLQFTTDANARPIKTDSAYLQALQYGKERGASNNLFTGEYSDVDNQIIYTMQTIQHAGLGSVGTILQPEALAAASHVYGTTTTINGGGGNAAAAAPYPYYFEAFSRWVYPALSGVAQTGAPAGGTPVAGMLILRDTYGYIGIVDATTGKIAYQRYSSITGGGATIHALASLAALADGAIGDMTSGVAPYLTTADNLGFLGLLADGSTLGTGSKIYETNSKGVPLGYGLGLGEMAAVCGYGRIPIPGGGFKTMAGRTQWIEPHNRAFSEGLEVSWGVAPFQRPGGGLPNYVLNVFARKIDGFPIIP